jgi:hypothetical protein
MSESISFTVPKQTTSRLVVATDHDPGDLPLAVLDRLALPFGAEAVERLGTPRLTIGAHPAAHSPWNIGHATLVTDDDDPGSEARALAAAHHIGVKTLAPPRDRPFALQLARAVACGIAEHLDAVPIDLDTGQILPTRPCQGAGFRLADDWLGAWLPPYRNAGRCTVSDDDIDGCSCVAYTTRGLSRFGLPELQMTGVSCPHDLAALNIVRTAAQRLLPMGNQVGAHTFPRDLALTGADFAAFWGAHEPAWSDGPVTVRLTPLGPHVMGLGPPAEFPGTLNEWLWDELPPVLYDMLGCAADHGS